MEKGKWFSVKYKNLTKSQQFPDLIPASMLAAFAYYLKMWLLMFIRRGIEEC